MGIWARSAVKLIGVRVSLQKQFVSYGSKLGQMYRPLNKLCNCINLEKQTENSTRLHVQNFGREID